MRIFLRWADEGGRPEQSFVQIICAEQRERSVAGFRSIPAVRRGVFIETTPAIHRCFGSDRRAYLHHLFGCRTQAKSDERRGGRLRQRRGPHGAGGGSRTRPVGEGETGTPTPTLPLVQQGHDGLDGANGRGDCYRRRLWHRRTDGTGFRGSHGASVVICDLQDELGHTVAKKITDAGGVAEYRSLDAAVKYSNRRCFVDGIDTTVQIGNIAGTAPVEQSLENRNRVMEVNSTGRFPGGPRA